MRLLEGAERLAVLHHLEVRAPHLVEYPPRVVLALRQRLQGGDRLLALELAEQAIAVGELPG